MTDSIRNVNDFLSAHWLAEVFPNRLKDLAARWRENAHVGKHSPLQGLTTAATPYLTALSELPSPADDDHPRGVTALHTQLLDALGIRASPTELETVQGDTPVTVPLLARVQGPASDPLHVLQAHPVGALDNLFSDGARLLDPLRVQASSEKVTTIDSPARAVQQLFLTTGAPRYLLLAAGSWLVLADVGRWAEGRYLAFDVRTALSRRDTKPAGELARHAGLCSADVLLPADDGTTELDTFTQDSERHAVGVSEDLREGLRGSIELIANEVLDKRRAAGLPVEGVDELPRELTTQSLRFLYRVLFLLYAEARPELGILPVGAPEYGAGYGMDRLRELIQVPLTGASRKGHHLHDSLALLFRLVNDGHGPSDGTTSDGLVFEALRADLFDPARTPHIDGVTLSNAVVQQVLQLLMLSKPSKRKGSRRGFISYAQLGINQLGAVYEGLMSYSGVIATEEMVELAKDGNADKGSWLVAASRASEYDEADLVVREDRLTGSKAPVRHRTGSFVFRLSGRDRQRSASYYTPEVLTRTVVKHALAELITEETTAADILEYRICEPALGSGAFLNEAINQLAKAYLDKAQAEHDERIEPERYAVEEQRVKAYLALHRAYGVDLNATAVELAEVSLWLNVMYAGLRAPWFGLHLRRGNSLIGARRATYDLAALGRANKSWLSTPPTERALTEGPIGDGEIHHFLLPADGWGAVAGAKQAKELVPDQAAALKAWKREVTKRPGATDLDRLRALARRVERLWTLTQRRLEVSECEIARDVDVWGAELPAGSPAVTRERVEDELRGPGSPYQRLRWVMDAWCALWFWPLDGQAPPTPAQWLDGLEAVLGREVKKLRGDEGLGLYGESITFDDLGIADDNERSLFGMKPELTILTDHPWLGRVREIAGREGFFHWELDFAQVFARGGFDLQVGNPPWVRPVWKDDVTLSEHDPFFSLQEKIPEKAFATRRHAVLESTVAEAQYLADLTAWAGTAEVLGSAVEHPVLSGVQTNLYTNFMERTWRSSCQQGIVGLLHPEGHFTDPLGGRLRHEVYERLRRHWQFTNERALFEDVNNKVFFSVDIYGTRRIVNFLSLSNLLEPQTLEASLSHDGDGEVPGMQFQGGGWDLRPHRSRLTSITDETLASWAVLFDPPGTPALQARLVRPLTREHLDVIATIAALPERMADVGFDVASGWHEKAAKEDGFIEWRTGFPAAWKETIRQGPHFTVSNPFARQPNEPCKSNKDWSPLDLEDLPDRTVPRTNYQRSCDRAIYDGGVDYWEGYLSTKFWRVSWRNMTQPGLERSLHAALVPPGPTHVHTVQTCAVRKGTLSEHDGKGLGSNDLKYSEKNTVLVAGLWSSLPYDYLVKIGGNSHVHAEALGRFPAPLSHSAASYLLLRALRLNCMTRDYAPLWEELYESGFAEDSWTAPFSDWPALAVKATEWTMDTPLRTDFERRAALVEIDALAALMLGLTADHLALMFRAQFPVLRKYEYEMYFDNLGRKIAKDHHAHGVKQQKDDYKLLQAYLRGEVCGDLLERYEPHPDGDDDPTLGFIRPDREVEMRVAHAEFTHRLGLR